MNTVAADMSWISEVLICLVAYYEMVFVTCYVAQRACQI